MTVSTPQPPGTGTPSSGTPSFADAIEAEIRSNAGIEGGPAGDEAQSGEPDVEPQEPGPAADEAV